MGDERPSDTFLVRLVGQYPGRILELVFICAFAISLALAIQAWAVKPFQIPSGSMKPTLEIGQRVLVERISTELGSKPARGEVIVFHPPAGVDGDVCGIPQEELDPGRACPEPVPTESQETFIKRVIAVPGDKLKIIDGVPVVNGRPLTGDWETIPCRPGSCSFPRSIRIPDDHYFVMGDNRPGSDDSRFWGPIPSAWIIGKAVVTYWPPSRVGGL
ncbi:MAG: signal peptidase I [Solirubrobacterales bacterium]